MYESHNLASCLPCGAEPATATRSVAVRSMHSEPAMEPCWVPPEPLALRLAERGWSVGRGTMHTATARASA